MPTFLRSSGFFKCMEMPDRSADSGSVSSWTHLREMLMEVFDSGKFGGSIWQDWNDAARGRLTRSKCICSELTRTEKSLFKTDCDWEMSGRGINGQRRETVLFLLVFEDSKFFPLFIPETTLRLSVDVVRSRGEFGRRNDVPSFPICSKSDEEDIPLWPLKRSGDPVSDDVGGSTSPITTEHSAKHFSCVLDFSSTVISICLSLVSPSIQPETVIWSGGPVVPKYERFPIEMDCETDEVMPPLPNPFPAFPSEATWIPSSREGIIFRIRVMLADRAGINDLECCASVALLLAIQYPIK